MTSVIYINKRKEVKRFKGISANNAPEKQSYSHSICIYLPAALAGPLERQKYTFTHKQLDSLLFTYRKHTTEAQRHSHSLCNTSDNTHLQSL